MEVEELKSNETILDWLLNINASENTKRSYVTAMQQYTEWLGAQFPEISSRRDES